MATYGATDRTRGVFNYSTESTNTSFSITVSSSLQAKSYYHSGYKINSLIAGKVVSSATDYVPSIYTSFTTFVTAPDYTKTYTKGKTAQTISIGSSYSGAAAGGYNAGGKSGSTSLNITIPAKPSYKVTYNANGGSNAPSSQTKWYGETLTLSSTMPTRTGYNFIGWATSSSATTAAYNPGGSYTGNSALTLYAVWQLAYSAPKISGINGSLLPSVFRCDSDGTANDDGVSASVSFSWSTFSDSYPGVSAEIAYKLSSASTWEPPTTISLTGTSGTVLNEIITAPFDVNSSYDIKITVFDSRSSSFFTTILSTSFFTLDFAAGGKAIGVGVVAPDATNHPNGLFKVGMDVELDSPLPIASGGTGATTEDGARANLNAIRIDLLWSNASSSSSFEGQTLDLGLQNYSAYIIVSRQNTSTTSATSVMQRTGYNAKIGIPTYSGGFHMYMRSVDYSSGSLKFYSGYDNGSTDNSVAIPRFIYGVRGIQY